jgi:hypothetical protein
VFAEVDVAAELRVMQQWSESHPKFRHRRAHCVRRWIVEWLTRARSRAVLRELVMPFGMYRGERLELVAQDDGYCRWLFEQSWFAADHPTVAMKLARLRHDRDEAPADGWMPNRLQVSLN